MTSTEQRTLTRGDTAALVAFCIAGLAIAANFVVYSIFRIVELARGTDVPVIVEFVGQPVQAPLGDGTDTITLGLDEATITAAQLPPIAAVPGIIGQVSQMITIIVVIGCLILLARSTLSGRVFSRRNTALVMTAGITGLVGFAAVRFFENMLANATVSVITDNAIENSIITVEPVAFILAAFIIAVIGTAFVIGDKLQRETEGLV
ncbi:MULTISPECIES: DUF2975 domain-containing protein [unclassified Microbacterium]|uniref:DUF2975 domain-containing protein n=1 Tax=unclassified Microbacterium TaxID=2609290 RepID=UPI0011C3B7FD|nr:MULTISPECIES: DUF2975 domain-containing protein [unclassified Microbacterium]MBT2483576.1 DUF2975 domain-containing protein [Microbacterium sp. ISL-108]